MTQKPWRAWVLGHGKPGHAKYFGGGFIDHMDLAQHFASKLHGELWETWPVIVCVQKRDVACRSWGKVEIVQVTRVSVPEFRADKERPRCYGRGCARVPTHLDMCKTCWRSYLRGSALASRL